jgi:phage gp46-like protein
MTTVAIAWDNLTGQGGWARDAVGNLALGSDLEAAVWTSLFSDRRALPDDVIPDGTDDRRGWWGDTYADKPIGSRLWLLDRAKRIPETLRRAEDYAREALAWLVEDGVAARVEVTAIWATNIGPNAMAILPVIIHRDGRRLDFRFDWAWQGA